MTLVEPVPQPDAGADASDATAGAATDATPSDATPGASGASDAPAPKRVRTDDGPLPRRARSVGWALVVAGIAITFWKLGGVSSAGYGPPRWQPWTWRPGPLLRNTMTTGGDTGAHVWTPGFLREHLLPALRPTGWSKDWYAGFPVLHFYFPLPMWTIVLLGFVIPVNVAFKLVTVAGIFTLPLALYAFARLSRLQGALPFLFALAAFPFLFDRQYEIYGGNVLSTMAGEFSFSISLSLAVLFLGLLTRLLRTGRGRGATAVVLAATGLSHLLPTLFALMGGVLLLVTQFPRAGTGVARVRRTCDALLAAACGGAIAGFWIVPFAAHLPYANDMAWEKTTEYLESLYPPLAKSPPAGAAVVGVGLVIALVAGIVNVVRFVRALVADRTPTDEARVGTWLTLVATVTALVFRFAPQHRLWNARALPFWFLCGWLLTAMGLLELGRGAARLGRRLVPRRAGRQPAAGLLLAGFACFVAVGTPLRLLPGWFPIPSWHDGRPGVQTAGDTDDESDAPYWAFDNYQGYEATSEWPELQELVRTLDTVAKTEGCGRAMWEYEDELDRYGTSMSLMLLPTFTHGCIGSMEGLYFESSATTPYHFLNAALTSARPSNPQRDLPYGELNLMKGVPKLRELGVRYYLAFSPAALTQAHVNPGLRYLASSPYSRDCSDDEKKNVTCPKRWEIFRVLDSEIVAPLAYEPAVVTGIGQSQNGGWLDVAVAQYQDADAYPVPLAASGPREWQRVKATVDKPAGERTYGVGTSVTAAERRPLPPVQVSGIVEGEDSVSFRVDRTGVPVVVRTSYFPNWRVSGAKGPYRLAPNLMVVVPTSTDVSLRFERDAADWAGIVLTGIGIAGAIALVRRDRRARRAERDAEEAAAEDASAVEERPFLRWL